MPRPRKHYVTFAEEGFSAFSNICDKLGIPKASATALCHDVNSRGEIGGFHPEFPLTVVPSRHVRGHVAPEPLRRSLEEFFRHNQRTMRAEFVVFDFSHGFEHARVFWQALAGALSTAESLPSHMEFHIEETGPQGHDD